MDTGRCRWFASGEVDFASRLAAADQSVRDEVDDKIMSPPINAPDGAVLLIGATPTALTPATSARDTILMMIGRDWIDPRHQPAGPTCLRSA